jgi:hypothetical protein
MTWHLDSHCTVCKCKITKGSFSNFSSNAFSSVLLNVILHFIQPICTPYLHIDPLSEPCEAEPFNASHAAKTSLHHITNIDCL